MVRSKMNNRFTLTKIGWENYKGTVEDNPKGGYLIKGLYEIDDHTVIIR
jgi:hypothetical protein